MGDVPVIKKNNLFILHNLVPVNTGRFAVSIYNFTNKRIGNRTFKNPNKEQFISAPVPQIVPEEIWNKAQEKLGKGRAESSRGVKFEYLVGLRIKCECGYAMRSHTSHHKYTNKQGVTKVHYHGKYCCPGHGRVHGRVNICTMPTVSETKVDDRVWQWIKEEIANPTILERKLREIQNKQRIGMSGKKESLETLYAHKEAIEGELKRLGSLYGKQGMPARIVDELIAQEGHKLQLTEEEIQKIEAEMVTPLTDEMVDNLLLFSIEFSEHLEATEATFAGRRTVLNGLNVTVEVFRRDGDMYLRCRSILSPKPREISLTVPHTL